MINENSLELKQNIEVIKRIYKMALLPCLLTILSANINVIVDGILVGYKLGSDALAAINLCMPLSLLLCVLGSFFSAGAAINSSKAIGANNNKRSNEYYKLAIISSYLISIIFTFIGIVFLNWICKILCSNMQIFPYVYTYSLVTIIGSIFKILIYVPFWYLRIDGQNKQVSIMMVVLALGNIILDALFIFVFNMGVFGAGLANVIATAAALFLGLYYLSNNKSEFIFGIKINWAEINVKEFIKDGIPSSLNNLCSTIRMMIINTTFLALGGGALVAVFTAVNGIFSIGECIILGVPQASNAMLGVYYGERDNQSCKLIVKCELYIGAILSAVFLVLCIVTSPFINRIYGIEESIALPIILMAVSIFPGLVCNALSSFYNISGRNSLSSLIIFLRLIIMTYLSIKISVLLGINIFAFMIITEVFSLAIIILITYFYYVKNKKLDRFLLCNIEDYLLGRVINFSVENDKSKICEASEKISDFCNDNCISIKATTRIQLAIEEALVLISELNNNVHENLDGFDIRVFIYDDLAGIRIRYDGLDFNPFEGEMEGGDYMGIRMISDLLETTIYKRTFGVNTLILLLSSDVIV